MSFGRHYIPIPYSREPPIRVAPVKCLSNNKDCKCLQHMVPATALPFPHPVGNRQRRATAKMGAVPFIERKTKAGRQSRNQADRGQRNIAHHTSNFSKPAAPNFSRLRRANATLFSSSRRVFEKNLSAKQIICSSTLTGCMSRSGRGSPCSLICSKVNPVPVCRSHTKA